MTQEQNRLRLPAKWKLASLRVTYFCDISAFPLSSSSFRQVFNEEPESESHKRSEFVSEFSTTKDGLVYKAAAIGPKVDFIIEPEASPENILNTGHPTLPEERDFLTELLHSTTALVENSEGAINRLAVGMHFLHQVEDKDEGYTFLSEYLEGLRLDAGASDFSYQINRKRSWAFNGSETYINRLSKWACAGLLIEGFMPGRGKFTSSVKYAASLTTDVNTQDPNSETPFDVSTLNKDQVKLLMRKLFDFSLEIADKGDIA